MKNLLILFVFLPIALFAQKNAFFKNTMVDASIGYNMYGGNMENLLDGLTYGAGLTKIFILDDYNALHVGLKTSYHSRNELIGGIGQVVKQNLDVSLYVGWNDLGDQFFFSGRISQLFGENKTIIGGEIKFLPLDKFFIENMDLMFYGSPHFIINKDAYYTGGLTLGVGVSYQFK